MTSQPNIPLLDSMRDALTTGQPINKPDGLTEHQSKQWWKLTHVARDQTGIGYRIDHTQNQTVLYPER